MAKMFVHYNGTVAAFKTAGLETTYNNHIVFIKGGADGTGLAIYTHGEYYGNLNEALAALEAKVNGMKYFSQIKVKDQLLSASAANSILSFLAALDQTELVEIDGNEKGVTIGLANSFVNKVNNELPTAINTEKSRAEAAEADIKALVGTRKDEASVSDDATAFARIAQLRSDIDSLTGGAGSVSTQINTALDALDFTSAPGDYIQSISQENGKITAVTGTFEDWATNDEVITAINGLESTINGKLDNKADKTDLEGEISRATGAENALLNAINGKVSTEAFTEKVAELEGADTATLLSAKSYADGLFGEGSDFASLESRVAANEDAIEVLNGTGEGSVTLTVTTAINNWANQVSPDNNTVDTFKELIDYAATHGSEYSTLAGVVHGNTTAIETLNGDGAGSVAKTVADAVADEAGLREAADTALGNRIDAIVAEGTGTIDTKVTAAVNAEKERAMDAESANATAIEDVSGQVAAIKSDYLKAADKTALLEQIDALNDVAGNGEIAAAKSAAEAAQATADGAVATANANKTAIEAMDLAEVVGYVKSVKQTDGKVEATAVANIPASDVTVTDNADNFAGTNVESVLAELAAMWAWEEINA